MPKVTRPITITLPAHGVAFGESVHALNFRMPLRADPFHKVVYVLQGRLRYRDRHAERELVAKSGTLLAVDAGTAHQLHDEAPATLLLLCLAPEFVTDDANRRALWRTLRSQASWHVPPGKPASRQFENLWRRGLLEQSLANASANVAVHALAAQILVALVRLPVGEPRGDTAAQRVERVAREMADSFYDEWTLDVAAARADLSRRRFSDLFRAQNGASFVATLTTLRLDHAAKLLRKGTHSVTGVAFSCGYRDLSHFYRAFRDRYGCAPGAFAKTRAFPNDS